MGTRWFFGYSLCWIRRSFVSTIYLVNLAYTPTTPFCLQSQHPFLTSRTMVGRDETLEKLKGDLENSLLESLKVRLREVHIMSDPL